MSTRKDGYYFVRIGARWLIAEYIKDMWVISDSVIEVEDNFFDEIHKDPILTAIIGNTIACIDNDKYQKSFQQTKEEYNVLFKYGQLPNLELFYKRLTCIYAELMTQSNKKNT